MDIDDQELDKYFRERTAGNGDEPDFNEQAWNAMERKLNRRDRRKLFVNLSFGVLLLLLSYIAINPFITKEQTGKTDTRLVKKTAAPATTKIKSDRQYLVFSRPPINQKTRKGFAKKLSPPGLIKSKHYVLAARENKSKANSNYLVDLPDMGEETHSLIYPKAILQSGISNTNPPDSTGASVYAALPADHNIMNADSSGKPSLKQPSSPEVKSIKYSLGFSAGPEFNSTGSILDSKGSMGLGFSLNANRGKFTLGSGLHYSAKNYTAQAMQYGNLSPALISRITNIDASCRVLEIPLKVSYKMGNLKKGAVSASAALSSYLMLREKYRFKYSSYGGQPPYNLTVKNANQHYFKVVGLSASYQLPLKNSRNQFAIEPYVKLPLQGVGQGQIYLKSYGVNLNMTYGLFSRKK